MTKKHYVAMAEIIGNTLAAAYADNGEQCRTAVYAALYEPFVALAQADNPQFRQLEFSAAVASFEAVAKVMN